MILLADEKKIKIIFSSNWKVEPLLAHQKNDIFRQFNSESGKTNGDRNRLQITEIEITRLLRLN